MQQSKTGNVFFWKISAAKRWISPLGSSVRRFLTERSKTFRCAWCTPHAKRVLVDWTNWNVQHSKCHLSHFQLSMQSGCYCPHSLSHSCSNLHFTGFARCPMGLSLSQTLVPMVFMGQNCFQISSLAGGIQRKKAIGGILPTWERSEKDARGRVSF